MTDIVKGPITVPDEAPMLFAENIQLRFENERLGRDYQAARDAHDKLLAENERFKISLSDTVQQTQEQMSEITALRAENERLKAALQAELADHEEAIAHDAGGLEYASLVGIPLSNADSLAQSVRYHERRAKLIRAALEK